MRFINGNIITECKRVPSTDECEGCEYGNHPIFPPPAELSIDAPAGANPCELCCDNQVWKLVGTLDIRDCDRMSWAASHAEQFKQVVESWNSAVIPLRDELDTATEMIK